MHFQGIPREISPLRMALIQPKSKSNQVRGPISRVLFRARKGPSATIHLGDRLRGPSSNQPGQRRGGGAPAHLETRGRVCPYSVLLRVGLALTDPIAGAAVRSYRTLSALPMTPKRQRRFVSVALSLGSLQPGVTRHPAAKEPGLSSRPQKRGPAAARPPDLDREDGTPPPQGQAGSPPLADHSSWKRPIESFDQLYRDNAFFDPRQSGYPFDSGGGSYTNNLLCRAR